MQEHSLFSTPSAAFIFCRLFDDGHSDWCEVISHRSFDLHFSTGDAGDLGSIPGSGKFPGEGNGNPLQYFAWEIPWTEEPGEL